MSLSLRYAVRSHTGLLREGNEDSVYAGPRVLAVADGMGGHAAGEVASAVAISAIADLDDDDPAGEDLLELLRERVTTANDHLREMVAGDSALDGMGTTLTAFLFAGSQLGLLHIGDSRAYLLRDGELGMITHDHTLVQTLVDEGRISEDEAGSHPQRSLITKALDGRSTIEPDLSVREARAGDRYLLCTDGLTGPVGSLDTLQEALAEGDPQAACDRLVQLALRGGGPDNVTVIVADVVDGAADGVPVVAGAAAETPQAEPEGMSAGAAARARAAAGREAPAPAVTTGVVPVPTAEEPRPRRRRRTGLVVALVVALLAAGAGAAYAYVRTQYYVGVDGEQVAVFRGVTGEVAGVRLSSVDERTDLTVDRLDGIARDRLEQGIVAEDRDDAMAIVARFEDRFPECVEGPAPAPVPAATSSPGPVPSPSPTAPTCPDGT